MFTPSSFTTEAQLADPDYLLQLAAFWQRVEQGAITSHDGLRLNYCAVRQPHRAPAIVFCSGRVESYLKYQELIHDCYQQGFSIYAMDHRGQGLSERLGPDHHLGHVDQFDDYIQDLYQFVQTVVMADRHSQLVMLGHSMGGAIGTLYLQQYGHAFAAAAFSAPMYGIQLPAPAFIIKPLAGWLNQVPKGGQPNYVLTGKGYQDVPFADNELSHSTLRYHRYRELYQQRPELQLGSPSNQWLLQALQGATAAQLAARNSTIPLLVLQASDDTIVDIAAQTRAQGGLCQLLVIGGARHEIFIETDERRQQGLAAVFEFFANHLHDDA
ncbi:alpha/beta fold hydrolase [Shewanella sp. NIFS-20-20]|uniref:alpha/beta fold hydrolase n=1 Tax=Shewanella sp. NIFS-20-20 TaxID=2853806 RepID=UPI001C44DF70|nr:alpha/beta fold hydrolase [Shewanella sp. NIFS-20-20]MBV7316103.1 alpha/beta fold hydrolase [Shewanella sp. NIFS-20-20]